MSIIPSRHPTPLPSQLPLPLHRAKHRPLAHPKPHRQLRHRQPLPPTHRQHLPVPPVPRLPTPLVRVVVLAPRQRTPQAGPRHRAPIVAIGVALRLQVQTQAWHLPVHGAPLPPRCSKLDTILQTRPPPTQSPTHARRVIHPTASGASRACRGPHHQRQAHQVVVVPPS